MKSLSIIIGVVVLIFGVGYLVTSNTNEPVEVTQEPTTDTVTEAETTEETVPARENDLDEEETATTDDATGVYTTYDADAIAESDADHILLFFHATWCPSCRALDADIIENADDIPPDVEIYKVDYDTATDLKRQYGVTTQHSIIEITAAGEAESDISHGLTLDDVLATI